VEDHGVTHEEWLDEQMTEWLAAGPHNVPAEPIQAAVVHARTHPRRRLPATGLGRNLMDRMHVTKVEHRPTSRMAFAVAGIAAVTVLLVVGTLLIGGQLDGQQRVAAPPNPVTVPRSDAPSQPGAVHVTADGCEQTSSGSMTHQAIGDDGWWAPGTMPYVDQFRYVRVQCEYASDDPRVVGTVTILESRDVHQDGTADHWGTVAITNDGGQWHGWYRAESGPSYTAQSSNQLLTGSGEYDHLRLRLTGHRTFDLSSPTELAGMVEPVDTVPVNGAEKLLAGECVTLDHGSQTKAGDRVFLSGVVLDCSGPVSDPRLGGTRTIVLDHLDQYADDSAYAEGTWTIENADGTWSGPVRGRIYAGYTTHMMSGELWGSGAYGGLLFEYSMIGDEGGYVVTGRIK
jgi:hypothetical protein